MALIRAVYVVGASRTPFGTFGGHYTRVSPTDLSVTASTIALRKAAVDSTMVSSVIIGNVIQSSKDAIYLSRHVGLRVGCPDTVPALTVNRLCGSGFQAIINAAHEIVVGDSEIVLTGGTESMTEAPFILRNSRFGMQLGKDAVLEDSLWAGLTDTYVNMPMAITAENLAEQYNITREECDAFALRSQRNWERAYLAGVLDGEITPMVIQSKGKPIEILSDEHPRPGTEIETLSKLKPVFKKNGVVTAGNASGVCDGAASLVLASEEAVDKYKLNPLARIVSYSITGCDPAIMGIGPVKSIENALRRANLKLSDVGIIEINEAFAAQALAVCKALDIDYNLINKAGGGISIGHPLAASGSRISTHIVHRLKQENKCYGIGSACIGGGQGIAIVFEKC